MSSRIEQIHNILTKLKAGHDGVEGCILVTAQGLPIDSATDGSADEDLISAMTASISSVSERVTQELGKVHPGITSPASPPSACRRPHPRPGRECVGGGA